MSAGTSQTTQRQTRATEALSEVSASLARVRVLAVQCEHGHHVAGVYRTDVGPVVQAASGRRSHGHRDRIDTPHRGTTTRAAWTDILTPATPVDDSVPAWCECGPWTLSRSALAEWIAAGERRVVIS